MSRLARARHLPCSPVAGESQWEPRSETSLNCVQQYVSRYPSGFFLLCVSQRRTSISCQEFTTAACRCGPCLRGNSAEWFHMKSLPAKPSACSLIALSTAVNNIELLTVSIGFTFAPPFIGGRPSKYSSLSLAFTDAYFGAT